MNESGYDDERTAGDEVDVDMIEERLHDELEQARYALAAWNQKALQAVRAYPGAFLLGAVGVGFLIGRLASRR